MEPGTRWKHYHQASLCCVFLVGCAPGTDKSIYHTSSAMRSDTLRITTSGYAAPYDRLLTPLQDRICPPPHEQVLLLDNKWYEFDVALGILMDEVKSGATSTWWQAFQRLTCLGPLLQKKPCITELMERYSDPPYPDMKRRWQLRTLRCLADSQDARALGLFSDVVMSESDELLQLRAAFGLAQFNVRSGVRTLLSLSKSESIYSQHGHSIGGSASAELKSLSRFKGWGLPEDRDDWEDWYQVNSSRFPTLDQP